MARKRRSTKGYRKLPFRFDNAIGAVTNDQFVGLDLADTVSDRTWVSSMDITCGIYDYTVGEGPVNVYVAHMDYTDAEIAEAIEADSGWNYGDLVAREHARRKVRHVGSFSLKDQGEEVLNEGRVFKVKLNMMLEENQTLQIGVHATGGGLTAGAILQVMGVVHGWRR